MSVTESTSFIPGLRTDSDLISSNNNNNSKRLSLAKSPSVFEIEQWARENTAELEMVRAWLKKQPHLPQHIQDEQILVFLHSCYGSVEMTKSKIDNFYTIRTHAPDIFSNRDLLSKDIVQAQKLTRIAPLRGATPEGWNAIFIDCINPDMSNFNFLEVMKYAGIAMDALMFNYPREEGNVVVFDMKNAAMAHVLKTNIPVLKKALVYTQLALPFRLKHVHVINAHPLINQIQTMMKPFMNSELRKLISIHYQDSMESFYKFIPKKCLPREYGGDGDSLQELNTKLRQVVTAHQQNLTDLSKLLVQENKRTGRAKTSGDVFGIEGSFKKLDLD